jgi:carboxymethylenebutenolidase
MTLTVDYYFAPQSPYVYLGHLRFWDIARRHGAAIRVLPMDLGGKVFPVSGGLPLKQRAPQRQAYRLLELKRFGEYLNMPIHPEPAYFPVAGDDAAKLIVAVDLKDGTDAAMHLVTAITRAVWAEQRNIADEAVLAELLRECELPTSRIEDAHSQAAHERYEANTEQAIAAGVFGAPSYVIDGEIFWGQDRLDFVDRRLAKG